MGKEFLWNYHVGEAQFVWGCACGGGCDSSSLIPSKILLSLILEIFDR